MTVDEDGNSGLGVGHCDGRHDGCSRGGCGGVDNGDDV